MRPECSIWHTSGQPGGRVNRREGTAESCLSLWKRSGALRSATWMAEKSPGHGPDIAPSVTRLRSGAVRCAVWPSTGDRVVPVSPLAKTMPNYTRIYFNPQKKLDEAICNKMLQKISQRLRNLFYVLFGGEMVSHKVSSCTTDISVLTHP